MNVIEASVAHVEVLAHLHAEGFAQPWSLEAFENALSAPGAMALIAVDDAGEPIGFVSLRAGGGEAEVLTLVTRVQARRSGIAKALMVAAAEKLRRLQTTKIFLEVATDNTNAEALYLSIGFTIVGRRKAYYSRPDGEHVDALVMALEL